MSVRGRREEKGERWGGRKKRDLIASLDSQEKSFFWGALFFAESASGDLERRKEKKKYLNQRVWPKVYLEKIHQNMPTSRERRAGGRKEETSCRDFEYG